MACEDEDQTVCAECATGYSIDPNSGLCVNTCSGPDVLGVC